MKPATNFQMINFGYLSGEPMLLAPLDASEMNRAGEAALQAIVKELVKEPPRFVAAPKP